MGQTQSQRQDDYAIEGSSNEPVIIREVCLFYKFVVFL